MAGGYERVNAHDHDEDDFEAPNSAPPRRQSQPVPNSPPPSFHSRASSRDRRGVDPALADAFDTDGDDSDDDADDRQRLVRADSTQASRDASRNPSSDSRPQPERHVTQLPPTASTTAGGPTTPFRIYGSGIQNEGVFSNLTAKPERGGEVKEEQPPTYEQAAADAAPPYWETTILAPGLGGPDEVYIDGMPVGSLFSFVWNGMISMSFQIVGFILTYLLHSTHAAKNGSRAGLGITLIQYGFYMKGTTEGDHPPKMNGQDGYAAPPDPNSHNFDPNAVTGEGGGGVADITGQEWIAYILMVVGCSINDQTKRQVHRSLPLSFKMAWRSSGASNKDLVENLWRNGLIKDQRVKDAFLKVDRAYYAPSAPYEDSPQSIGHKATISAPHMHATAAESLLPHLTPSATKPAPRVLDIGSGSGYLTHLLAELVGEKGLVVGLEHIKALRDLGERNMRKSDEGRALLDSGKVRFHTGDGRKGWVEAPRPGEEGGGTGWDAIHVGAAAVELHQELVDQLRAPGRMFIPVEDDNGYDQYVWAIDKKEDGSVVKEKLFGVRYVPLTDAPKS
ncbi:Protein-L-isoaspartate O-methyltransferase [Colletotrichum gloeosporioides]|uniref:protein-L-isoaspartate(D-aspartate) O-methyltransferase n=1 Tax=Colletotrichum gloeosporioides TaxID=474922 RepID=A0A8H4CAG2_COLGL|nr:Protein-L-isoaspartate O-methyltransferase [Colletotrichum gloeosporioides]KAF3800159.1 Protein-L-isoaspartate O-methyltransferase [Colletotrichum gloeosporioides]